jgi:Tol biopolymer transport system component
MKAALIRTSAVLAIVSLAAVTIPAQTSKPSQVGSQTRPSKQYTIEQFLDTVSITGASFSPDESRILFSSNKTGIWNVYSVPVSGGGWKQITNSTTDSTYAVGYFPKDERILLT